MQKQNPEFSGMRQAILAAACVVWLAGCGLSLPGSIDKDAPMPAGKPHVPVTEDRAGTITNYILPSRLDGKDIPITLFEPTEMKKGGHYPLVIYSHGWAGKRAVAPDFYTDNLTQRGFYVITFDQRGFGASGGTVRVMDPDYDAQDMIQILDWAEELPGLQRFEDERMAVGSIGGSYGGMFQFSLAGSDPEHRLRVIAPDVAPYDLNAALYPGNVTKSGWGVQLLAGLATGNPDPITLQLFLSGIETGNLDQSQQNFLAYHSLRYFCDGQPAGAQEFAYGTADTFIVPPGPLPKIDAFLSQGFRDTLFNFNHVADTYDCLRKLGGDVRIHTHQSGHIFSQTSITNVPGAEGWLDPAYSIVTIPNSGDVAGNHQCGSVNSGDATWAWFEEKLQGKTGATAAAIKAGHNICMSLSQGDAIAVQSVKEGGEIFAIDDSLPQFNSVASAAVSVAGEPVRELLLATQVLMTVPAGGALLAGIPTMDLQLTNPLGESPICTVPNTTCDPVLFLGIGHRKAGQTRWDLIDDQLMPVRGFGAHAGRLVGIAERLDEGDDIALLIYGYHVQYPLNPSRDFLTPALNVSGSIALPLLAPGEVAQEDAEL